MRSGLLVMFVAACWTGSGTLTGAPAASSARFTITEASFGPIDANTPATLAGLRAVLPGLVVARAAGSSNELFDVFAGGKKLFYVVPTGDRVFGVHATSADIAVATRPWRAGKPLGAVFPQMRCECWGGNDYTTCYKPGEHVAVVFHHDCTGMAQKDSAHHIELERVPVERVVWQPAPWGEDRAPDSNEGDGDDPSDP